MSTDEQIKIKAEYYNEAILYMNNTKEILKKANKTDDIFSDINYVKIASGTAYNAVLLALDGYFKLKEVPESRGSKNIDYYRTNITKLDKKLLDYVNDIYEVLHLSGYYDGIKNVNIINEGFYLAYKVIDKIKP